MNVHAEVAAMVTNVLVEPGEMVADGQLLVLLESMKMEIPVAAPRAGVVAEVAVVVGDAVIEGDALLRLTPIRN